MTHTSIVVAVLGQLHDVSDPEREDGKCPRSKAGWIRVVLLACNKAGYAIVPHEQLVTRPPTDPPEAR